MQSLQNHPAAERLFVRYFPAAHAYFDKKDRFKAVLDAIHECRLISANTPRSQRTYSSSYDVVAYSIIVAIDNAIKRCSTEPDLLEFLSEQAIRLQKRSTRTDTLIAGVLLHCSAQFAADANRRLDEAKAIFRATNSSREADLVLVTKHASA